MSGVRAQWLVMALVTAASSGLANDDRDSCPIAVEARQLGPGLRIEKVRVLTAPNPACLRIVRIDPGFHSLRLLAVTLSAAKTPVEWIRSHGLAGVINASMYQPSGRPVGLTVIDGRVVYGRETPGYGGFLAFNPKRNDVPPVVIRGMGCIGFDLAEIRRNYRSLVQNQRMLDCHGLPIEWADPRRFSAAVVGLDFRGHIVFAHTVEPLQMTELSRALADPRLGIQSALYVEGGKPAQLSLRYRGTTLDRIGRYEFGPLRRGGTPQKLPVVLGFSPRAHR